MCYKHEKQQQTLIKLNDKLKNMPVFIADFFVRYKSATTAKVNYGYIQNLLQWLIENRYIQKDSISYITKEDMDNIMPEHIAKYFGDLQNGISGNKNSLESINTKKNIFSAFWEYLVKRKYVSDNIIKDDTIKLKYKAERKQKTVKIPSEDQLQSFLNNLNEGNKNEYDVFRNITIVQLVLGSGIRSEELINLDIKDLYIDELHPYIMVLGKGKLETYDKVFISNNARMYLEDYLVLRKEFLKNKNFSSEALFLSNERNRISKGAIDNFFSKYSNEEINPHMLRHLYGTRLYNKTKDIVKVQKQLRHASIETAAEYYVCTSEEDIANAVADL